VATASSTRPFLRWVMLCAAAELLGIAAAAAWYGVANIALGEPEAIPLRVVAWFVMALAAVPEGLILGGLQTIGLRMFVPDVSARRWIGATILVGFLGWGIGTFIPMFVVTEAPAGGSDPRAELRGAVLFAAVFGLLIGAVFGVAQAWGLPRGGGRRLAWVIANAVGWALALPMIYGAAQIATGFSGWGARIAVWAAGGAAAGIVIGMVTGVALLWMTQANGRQGARPATFGTATSARRPGDP